MDSKVNTADLACEYSGDGRDPKKLWTDQKQRNIPASVRVLCSTCAKPRWESEWIFSIEDGVTINKSNQKLHKTGDAVKDKEKAGKSQKMARNMGRVFYHRPPRDMLLSP